MGFQIEDGRGTGKIAKVNTQNRLDVSSQTDPRIFYASRDNGLAFTVNSVDADSDPGDYVLYLKNTSTTKNLYVSDLHAGAGASALWKLFFVTGTGAGTTVTAGNLNGQSGLASESISFGDAAVTGLTITSTALLKVRRSPAGAHANMIFNDSLILGPQDAIALEFDTGATGTTDSSIIFHFEDF